MSPDETNIASVMLHGAAMIADPPVWIGLTTPAPIWPDRPGEDGNMYEYTTHARLVNRLKQLAVLAL